MFEFLFDGAVVYGVYKLFSDLPLSKEGKSKLSKLNIFAPSELAAKVVASLKENPEDWGIDQYHLSYKKDLSRGIRIWIANGLTYVHLSPYGKPDRDFGMKDKIRIWAAYKKLRRNRASRYDNSYLETIKV